ncbi:serine hydrolase [Sneathiella chinensis]|uniref:Peptidase M15 n=1 Tax=Sneathiella chinensis TaxID=349750 RepID=A0ABQ5U7P3_9PROT|nr:serine hydrolase [Sneathiella chinensis]GLQ07693.1 peptidase M15 [Sneathiella chinensis]
MLALFVVLAATLAPTTAEASRYASVVMDSRTGKILFSRNANQRLYPASLTKIMTLYMTFEAINQGKLSFDQKLKVSARAAGQTPTKLGLKKGSTISVRDAVFGLITKSANDAATVLAEAMAPTEAAFARMMTEKASKLGMHRTSFRNASGLPNRRQRSTAHDMAILGAAMIHDFPQFYHYLSLQSFDYKGKSFKNHNNLLSSYKGADGIKTGYIRASGFNLVASAKRGNHRLIGVVFGGRTAKSRDLHMKSLLDKGFERMELAQPSVVPIPNSRPVSIALGSPHNTVEGGIMKASTASTAATIPTPQPAILPDPSDGDWGIQVGAFSRVGNARDQLNHVTGLTGGMMDGGRFNIQKVSTDSGSIYRAQMVGFTEQNAKSICRTLMDKSVACFVVSPVDGNLIRVARN